MEEEEKRRGKLFSKITSSVSLVLLQQGKVKLSLFTAMKAYRGLEVLMQSSAIYEVE
jgi:hypothetical protein